MYITRCGSCGEHYKIVQADNILRREIVSKEELVAAVLAGKVGAGWCKSCWRAEETAGAVTNVKPKDL
jgi:hypothetical protein